MSKEIIDINVIIAAAEAGGKVIRDYFGKTLDVQEKSTANDFRTQADTESEEAILAVLDQKFPKHNIFSEEVGAIDNQSEYTFIIDPLDGSNNFVLGIPNFSVSIALCRGEKLIVGVVYLPMIEQVYYAEAGKGAFMNQEKISVNSESDMRRATVVYTCGYVNSQDYYAAVKKKLNEFPVKRNLDNWSPAVDFCLLASGKIEAVINNQNEIYDYSAGKLIAREAGATITDFFGQPETSDKNDRFVASNGTGVHQQLLNSL